MKLTAHLRNLLAHHQTQLPEAEYKNLESEAMRLVGVYVDVLLQFQAGAGRANKIHQLVEEQNTLYANVPTTCAKGCGACCHLEVEITEDEAQLLARTIQNQNLKIDHSRLENQAQRKRGDEAWKARTSIENRCVFLDEASCCTVYESRPMICRKHSVVSPPSQCMSMTGEPVPRIIPLNEIIASAVINLPRNHFGSLPKMLKQALEREKEIVFVHGLEILETDQKPKDEAIPVLEASMSEPDPVVES